MFEGIPVVGLTAPALLGVVVLMVLGGLLIPRRYLKDKIEECERWRLAYEVEREARATSNQQSIQLLEFAKTNHSLITAIFQNLEEKSRRSGEPDATRKA